MGAWGTYPKDSDAALDLMQVINDDVNKHLEDIYWEYFNCKESEQFRPYNGYPFSGVVMLMLQKGFHVDMNMFIELYFL